MAGPEFPTLTSPTAVKTFLTLYDVYCSDKFLLSYEKSDLELRESSFNSVLTLRLEGPEKTIDLLLGIVNKDPEALRLINGGRPLTADDLVKKGLISSTGEFALEPALERARAFAIRSQFTQMALRDALRIAYYYRSKIDLVYENDLAQHSALRFLEAPEFAVHELFARITPADKRAMAKTFFGEDRELTLDDLPRALPRGRSHADLRWRLAQLDIGWRDTFVGQCVKYALAGIEETATSIGRLPFGALANGYGSWRDRLFAIFDREAPIDDREAYYSALFQIFGHDAECGLIPRALPHIPRDETTFAPTVSKAVRDPVRRGELIALLSDNPAGIASFLFPPPPPAPPPEPAQVVREEGPADDMNYGQFALEHLSKGETEEALEKLATAFNHEPFTGPQKIKEWFTSWLAEDPALAQEETPEEVRQAYLTDIFATSSSSAPVLAETFFNNAGENKGFLMVFFKIFFYSGPDSLPKSNRLAQVRTIARLAIDFAEAAGETQGNLGREIARVFSDSQGLAPESTLRELMISALKPAITAMAGSLYDPQDLLAGLTKKELSAFAIILHHYYLTIPQRGIISILELTANLARTYSFLNADQLRQLGRRLEEEVQAAPAGRADLKKISAKIKLELLDQLPELRAASQRLLALSEDEDGFANIKADDNGLAILRFLKLYPPAGSVLVLSDSDCDACTSMTRPNGRRVYRFKVNYYRSEVGELFGTPAGYPYILRARDGALVHTRE